MLIRPLLLSLQLLAQREMTARQVAKTAALEAALVANSAKAAHDHLTLGRVLEERVSAQTEVVRDRLEAQVRVRAVPRPGKAASPSQWHPPW